MTKIIDLTGHTYGRLLVLHRVANGAGGRVRYRCKCSCGTEISARSNGLRSGNTRSCGCLQKELATGVMKHGYSKTPTYFCWDHMKQRCYNSKHKSYKDYGDRGIIVCDRWLKFENFLADMGEVPEGLSLDRYPDVNGNYEPHNCRWATDTEQNRNRRNTVMVIFKRDKIALVELAEKLGISYPALYNRHQRGTLYKLEK
jgi:hypothetical protein